MKKKLAGTAIATTGATLLIWTAWGNATVGVTRYAVESSRLPASFGHFKIAVVSDLHNAEFGKNNSRITARIGQEQPDLIAVTGDLVDKRRPDVPTAVALIRRLTAIAPCYYVTGNHEAWRQDEYPALEEKLLDAGTVILRDRAEPLTRNGETIQLAGVFDPSFIEQDDSLYKEILRTKLRKMDLTEDYRILLSHRPEHFDVYKEAKMDLVLCGHAHGGQFRLPFIGGLFAPAQGFFPKYDAGLFRENDTAMIVSRGIGESIIPVRFNNRPEIVIVTLQKAR